MENKTETKKRNIHPNRVLLSAEALGRVDKWIEEVQKTFRGTKLSRADVVNQILLNRPVALSTEELRRIGSLNYDEIRFATWALTALKEKRARGEDATLRKLLEDFGVSGLQSPALQPHPSHGAAANPVKGS